MEEIRVIKVQGGLVRALLVLDLLFECPNCVDANVCALVEDIDVNELEDLTKEEKEIIREIQSLCRKR